MTDDSDLEGLDPYDLMDSEAARLDGFFSTLAESAWTTPSACEGWAVRDVLAHLAGSEEYNRACLADAVGPLLERYGARGVTDVDSFNALGVADRAGRTVAELLAEWRAESGETRRALRERDGGDLPTMVGPYPVRLQAFHLAAELATHADDVDVPVTDDEVADRAAWRAAVARFVLRESKPDVTVERVDGGSRVAVGGVEAVLDGATLSAAVNGRLPAEHPLDPALRQALSAMP